MRPAGVDKKVIEHWYSLVSGQNFSSKEFYAKVEEVHTAQRLPPPSIARVDVSEGAILSDKRGMKVRIFTARVCVFSGRTEDEAKLREERYSAGASITLEVPFR